MYVILKQLLPVLESTPEEFRTYYLSRQVPPTENVHEIRDISAGGVPCRLYRPNASKNLGLLVYYHGGGWVIGNLDSYDAVCRSLANKMGTDRSVTGRNSFGDLPVFGDHPHPSRTFGI